VTAAERYALTPLGDGGLLLDLEEGGLFELNRTAFFIWRRFIEGDGAEAIAAMVAARHGIDVERARADVAAALKPGALPPPPAPEDYQFHRTEAGYVHLYRDRPTLALDASGDEVSVVAAASDRRPRRLGNSLRALVPKILSLRGFTVLHASAVVANGRLLVFTGRSGAGKTTTARTLAERGAELVSEDKLIVHAERAGAVAARGGEAHIESWLVQATLSLFTEGRFSCAGLDVAAGGERLPIAEIGFLDVACRQGDELVARRLGVQETATASFHAMFLGTALAAGWRRQLEAAASLAECVPGYAMTMPAGLTALGRAAIAVERRGSIAS
jgi:hypothetical protein